MFEDYSIVDLILRLEFLFLTSWDLFMGKLLSRKRMMGRMMGQFWGVSWTVSSCCCCLLVVVLVVCMCMGCVFVDMCIYVCICIYIGVYRMKCG